MDRNQRLAMLAENDLAISRIAEDRAVRAYQRELHGEPIEWPLPEQPRTMVRKVIEDARVPAPVAVQSFEPSDEFIDATVGFIAERLAEELQPLREKLSQLETEIAIMRSEEKSNVA